MAVLSKCIDGEGYRSGLGADHLVSTFSLGTIKQAVSQAQGILQGRRSEAGGHAKADAYMGVRDFRQERGRCHSIADAFGNHDSFFESGVGKDDRKFLAANAGGDIARTHMGGDELAELDKHPVAGFMAVCIVDVLEVIEVAQQQAIGCHGQGQAFEGALKAAAIQQSRQRIAFAQRLLEAHTVLHDAHDQREGEDGCQYVERNLRGEPVGAEVEAVVLQGGTAGEQGSGQISQADQQKGEVKDSLAFAFVPETAGQPSTVQQNHRDGDVQGVEPPYRRGGDQDEPQACANRDCEDSQAGQPGVRVARQQCHTPRQQNDGEQVQKRAQADIRRHAGRQVQNLQRHAARITEVSQAQAQEIRGPACVSAPDSPEGATENDDDEWMAQGQPGLRMIQGVSHLRIVRFRRLPQAHFLQHLFRMLAQ